ncbi:hypothetical protein DFJ73DRAFT_916158 [Zopfochytrium polystomum]|nr:hypothetical protein DFJ73DRAFT_916158 [Zopfochytrium polystomum]
MAEFKKPNIVELMFIEYSKLEPRVRQNWIADTELATERANSFAERSEKELVEAANKVMKAAEQTISNRKEAHLHGRNLGIATGSFEVGTGVAAVASLIPVVNVVAIPVAVALGATTMGLAIADGIHLAASARSEHLLDMSTAFAPKNFDGLASTLAEQLQHVVKKAVQANAIVAAVTSAEEKWSHQEMLLFAITMKLLSGAQKAEVDESVQDLQQFCNTPQARQARAMANASSKGGKIDLKKFATLLGSIGINASLLGMLGRPALTLVKSEEFVKITLSMREMTTTVRPAGSWRHSVATTTGLKFSIGLAGVLSAFEGGFRIANAVSGFETKERDIKNVRKELAKLVDEEAQLPEPEADAMAETVSVLAGGGGGGRSWQSRAAAVEEKLAGWPCHLRSSPATGAAGRESDVGNVGNGDEYQQTPIRASNLDVSKSVRRIVDSPRLAAAIWFRIRDAVPAALSNGRTVVGLKERLRFFKYNNRPDCFAPHREEGSP